ncbi:MAG TPA: glycosyltransferase [Flavobacteriaceae bacterium]|nr:glycosyltransferase [Flavobacteriaceae bacterium]
MKILLVGEYSRLHNSLKEGLQALGHEVQIIGTGDFFKDFPVDMRLKRRFDTGLAKKIKVGIYKLFKIDISSRALLQQFFSFEDSLKAYDIVQLINESSLGMQPAEEIKAIDFLKKYNENIFMLSCGTDYTSVSYAMDKKIRYSIFTPLLENRIPERFYIGALRFLKPEYKKLHQYLYKEIIQGVIASDMDYHIPLENNSKYLGLIPNPINTEKLAFQPIEISNKVVIFMGINRNNFLKKGIDFFEKALVQIQKEFSDKVEVVTAENLPYDVYIKQYDRAHILLDQVYSFDQGFNALEAMAKGKVVFTGAEREWEELYNYKEDEVCINALPDVDYLVNKLRWLINNPQEIKRIGSNARTYVEKDHDYIKVAKTYLDTWQSAID